MKGKIKSGFKCLFAAQRIVRPEREYWVYPSFYLLWWCAYHTIGRAERAIDRLVERYPER